MKPWVWLRVLAGLLALFAVGHTLGTAVPKVTHGSQEAAVFEAMQSFHFSIMGFNRSHWDFYRGFALIISWQLLVMMAIAWQLSSISKHNPQQALPMAFTLFLGSFGLLVLSWRFFFGAPIFMSIAAWICSALVVVSLLQVKKRILLGARSVEDGQIGIQS